MAAFLAKKGEQLSLNTLVIGIIILVVLVLLVLLYFKSSGFLFGSFGNQINAALGLVQ